MYELQTDLFCFLVIRFRSGQVVFLSADVPDPLITDREITASSLRSDLTGMLLIYFARSLIAIQGEVKIPFLPVETNLCVPLENTAERGVLNSRKSAENCAVVVVKLSLTLSYHNDG